MNAVDGERRAEVGAITLGRMVSNTSVRLWGPFLPQVAGALGVSISTVGLALSVGEFAGLAAPAIGARADRADKSVMMAGGLALVAVGTALAAASPTAAVLAVALVVISAAKLTFDTAMGAWIAERVPYEGRARVVGFTETSWAGSLLIVIPLLLLLSAATSWRWAVAVIAVLNTVFALVLRRRLTRRAPVAVAAPLGEAPPPAVLSRPRLRAVLWAWPTFLALALLMTSSQFVFVTFSSWLEDDFGFSTAAISGVSFALGAAELAASTGTMRFTDGMGKRAAALAGVALMVPAAVAMAAAGSHAAIAVLALVAFVGGFEFALVSSLPLITELNPEARGASLGVAVGMGTIGRGVAAAASTRLYDTFGMPVSALSAGVVAAAVVPSVMLGSRRHALR